MAVEVVPPWPKAITPRPRPANPNSAGAHDSLSDGYAKAGMLKKAAESSDHAAALAAEFNLPNRHSFIERAKKRNAQLNEGTAKPE